MSNTMIYKDYVAHIKFDAKRMRFTGLVLIQEPLRFQGNTVESLSSAFRTVVDEYLSQDQKIQSMKAKPCQLSLQVRPEVHASCKAKAQSAGISLNQWAINTLLSATLH